jgi:hypothetical protein
LFDSKTGAFAVNIRDIGGDDSELRESLTQFGWIEEYPALVDENGVVLVGHRRLKIAEEEKIEPVIKKLALGNGDAADAERLKLAIVSNIGSKPMTKEDRKRIAEHLYGAREWTMERIAEAFNVSKATISGDLRDCSTPAPEPGAVAPLRWEPDRLSFCYDCPSAARSLWDCSQSWIVLIVQAGPDG